MACAEDIICNGRGQAVLWQEGRLQNDPHQSAQIKTGTGNDGTGKKDQKAIAEFYWSTAEHFQHDELYREAIFYHLQLISHSHANSFKEYLFIDIDGIKHSRFESIAYCFDKLGEIENSVRSILNALMDVMSEFGNNSEEFNYYASYLDQLMEDSVKGPILHKVLSEFEK